MSDDFKERAADDPQLRLSNLRLHQKRMQARMQQLATIYEIATATDWEARYVAEGVQAIEDHANR